MTANALPVELPRGLAYGATSNDALAELLEAHESARAVMTAAKRKKQRVLGALEALDQLEARPGPQQSAEMLLEAEVDVAKAQEELAFLLEQSDGADAFKRRRAAWHEAGGIADFARSHEELRQYLPAVEREVAEAREAWERMQPAREQLSTAKRELAQLQGRFYALLEVGLAGLDRPTREVVLAQRAIWQQEELATASTLERRQAVLDARRARLEQHQREQGWRKGAVRFGETVGLSSSALLSVRLAIMEVDATWLRLSSKGVLAALGHVSAAHEQTLAELHSAAGKVGFLAELQDLASTPEQLQAAEYEAAVEMEVLRGTLQTLAARTAEARHLRLAFQSKAVPDPHGTHQPWALRHPRAHQP